MELLIKTWKKKKILMRIVFIDFLIFYQIFLSPQVKRCTIIGNKRGIYQLPHELPNDMKLIVLGN